VPEPEYKIYFAPIPFLTQEISLFDLRSLVKMVPSRSVGSAKAEHTGLDPIGTFSYNSADKLLVFHPTSADIFASQKGSFEVSVTVFDNIHQCNTPDGLFQSPCSATFPVILELLMIENCNDIVLDVEDQNQTALTHEFQLPRLSTVSQTAIPITTSFVMSETPLYSGENHIYYYRDPVDIPYWQSSSPNLMCHMVVC
jgi:hypothetical protein